MTNWKLIKFETNKEDLSKIDFIFSDGVRTKTFTLKEKANWPNIYGEDLDKVEKWLRETYLDLINFATFGAIWA